MAENAPIHRPGLHRPGGLISKFRTPIIMLVLLALAYPFYWWFIKRVEVPQNHILVLVNKGALLSEPSLPRGFETQVVLYPDMVKKIAESSGKSEQWVRDYYPGIQYEVLPEGRYFISPIYYERVVVPATIIENGQFGVKIRKYGRPLSPGHVVATAPDEAGPIAGTLEPSRYNINPYAYDVQKFDQIVIREGWTGVVSMLSGPDPKSPNEYTVAPGERGVQSLTLGPGSYRNLNPYQMHVQLVDARSHKYDITGEDAIEFPSWDGFTIHLEGTVEWAIYPEMAPLVTVEIGDLDDVVSKVIRPYATSLARIQGSKLTARDFIGSREEFQKRWINDLQAQCRTQGIQIRAATVRELKPPERVRMIIRQRELADQTINRYENETAEAVAKAQLVEQEELAKQNAAIGEVNKDVVALTTLAEQTAAVSITEATQRLQVAQFDLDSARKQAEGILSMGKADAQVVLFGFQAQAEPLAAAVAAFGDGMTYARNQYLQKVAPSIKTVLTNTDGPLADVFRAFQYSTPSGQTVSPHTTRTLSTAEDKNDVRGSN